jgi:hypothetical protein
MAMLAAVDFPALEGEVPGLVQVRDSASLLEVSFGRMAAVGGMLLLHNNKLLEVVEAVGLLATATLQLSYNPALEGVIFPKLLNITTTLKVEVMQQYGAARPPPPSFNQRTHVRVRVRGMVAVEGERKHAFASIANFSVTPTLSTPSPPVHSHI